MNDKLRQKLDALPHQSGVYIMKDGQGRIIYVGKALSLRNRVRQYFQSSRNQQSKVAAMVRHVEDLDIMLASGELEALVLEGNLIKKHRPHYNILLKDDKQFPYVRIDMNQAFPRVEIVRRVKDDGARYFGPFQAAHSVREVMDALKKIFPVRTCKRDLPRTIGKERPCLNHQIGRCLAPCQGFISQEDYHAMMRRVADFLSGRHGPLVRELTKKMNEASAALDFESAAAYRNQIQAVESVVLRQKAISPQLQNRDVIGIVPGAEGTVAVVLFIRDGRMIGSQTLDIRQAQHEADADIVSSIVAQYYASATFIPKEILLPAEPEDIQVLEQWLGGKAGHRVYLRVPKRGEKRDMVILAQQNAMQTQMRRQKNRQKEHARTTGAMAELQAICGLPGPPRRIEGFDISNTQGVYSVASMVVFEDGRPANKAYRRFRIKTVEGSNDFASLAETLGRRFQRLLDGDEAFGAKPDLVMIDGGREQLKAVQRVLNDMGVQVHLCSLAKKFEEIYLPDRELPVRLPRTNMGLQLLQRVRDEAHRFAVTYHRGLRSKGSLASVLEQVPGIGKKRRVALMRAFGGIGQIKDATVEELAEVPGMTAAAAKAVKDALSNEDMATHMP
ncbi:MAG: excinuclease ABC subunit UvrC [Christensenellales bacterium]|jgi:excinuclease ABC subunit C